MDYNGRLSVVSAPPGDWPFLVKDRLAPPCYEVPLRVFSEIHRNFISVSCVLVAESQAVAFSVPLEKTDLAIEAGFPVEPVTDSGSKNWEANSGRMCIQQPKNPALWRGLEVNSD